MHNCAAAAQTETGGARRSCSSFKQCALHAVSAFVCVCVCVCGLQVLVWDPLTQGVPARALESGRRLLVGHTHSTTATNTATTSGLPLPPATASWGIGKASAADIRNVYFELALRYKALLMAGMPNAPSSALLTCTSPRTAGGSWQSQNGKATEPIPCSKKK